MATTTLVVAAPTSPSNGIELFNAALAVQLFESPAEVAQVAERLGVAQGVVSAQLTAVARADVDAIDVTAIGSDAASVVRWSEQASQVLIRDANAKSQLLMAQARAEMTAKRADAKQQNDAIVAQLRSDPGDADLIQAKIAVMAQIFGQYDEKLDQLEGAPSTFRLEVLQGANAVRINGGGYARRYGQDLSSRSPEQGVQPHVAVDFDESTIPAPKKFSKWHRIALGGIAGLVLGVLAAFVSEIWDERIGGYEDVTELTGITTLAEVPRLKRSTLRRWFMVDRSTGRVPAAEQFATVRSATLLELAIDATAPRSGNAGVVLVASPGPREGRTLVTAGLAASLAEQDLRVLIVDGDFRLPSLGRHLAPVPDLVDPLLPAGTRIPGVSYVAAPRGARTVGDAASEVRRSIRNWRSSFDVIVVDSPPMLSTNDANELMGVVDAVVLVLRMGQTSRSAVTQVVDEVGLLGSRLIGIVLNACDHLEVDEFVGETEMAGSVHLELASHLAVSVRAGD